MSYRERRTFNSENPSQEEQRYRCPHCKSSTFHRELIHLSNTQSDDETYFYSHYFIMRCLGCDEPWFMSQTHFSEDIDFNERGPFLRWETKVYPPITTDRAETPDADVLPSGVYRVYSETLSALNSGLNIVAGMGLRAIVEAVCRDRSARGDRLQERIGSLGADGLISHTEEEILHGIRYMGNRAAHEIQAHSSEELEIALRVVEHLLQAVFILPKKAKSLLRGEERGEGGSASQDPEAEPPNAQKEER